MQLRGLCFTYISIITDNFVQTIGLKKYGKEEQNLQHPSLANHCLLVTRYVLKQGFIVFSGTACLLLMRIIEFVTCGWTRISLVDLRLYNAS